MKQIMSSSAILTLLLSLVIIPAQVVSASAHHLDGIFLCLFVIGWSVPFSQIVVTSRLTFMAAVIFWANIFYIFLVCSLGS